MIREVALPAVVKLLPRLSYVERAMGMRRLMARIQVQIMTSIWRDWKRLGPVVVDKAVSIRGPKVF